MLPELIIDEAAKYGRLIRDFEDLNLENSLIKARADYDKFIANLPRETKREARRIYGKAYTSNPIGFNVNTD